VPVFLKHSVDKNVLKKERHFRPKSRSLTCTMLHCIRPVFLYIWRAKWCVCFWPSWFSRHNSYGRILFSTCMLHFYAFYATFMPLVAAFCLPNFFSNMSNSSFLPFIFQHSARIIHELCFLNWYKFLIWAVTSLLNSM